MVSIDVSVFFQIANFLLLIWLMNVILYKPVRNILIERQKKIDQLENNIKKFDIEANNKNREYIEGVNKARKDGEGKKESFLQEGQAEEDRIIGEIIKKNQEELLETSKKIVEDVKKVKEDLSKDIDTFAGDICYKILGRSV